MHRKPVPHRVHHLPHQHLETARLRRVQRMRRREVGVEILQRLNVLLRLGGLRRRKPLFGQNGPAVPRHRLAPLRRDRLDQVIAAFNGLPRKGRVAQPPVVKGVQLLRETFRG